jgi:hypothetical protein
MIHGPLHASAAPSDLSAWLPSRQRTGDDSVKGNAGPPCVDALYHPVAPISCDQFDGWTVSSAKRRMSPARAALILTSPLAAVRVHFASPLESWSRRKPCATHVRLAGERFVSPSKRASGPRQRIAERPVLGLIARPAGRSIETSAADGASLAQPSARRSSVDQGS